MKIAFGSVVVVVVGFSHSHLKMKHNKLIATILKWKTRPTLIKKNNNRHSAHSECILVSSLDCHKYFMSSVDDNNKIVITKSLPSTSFVVVIVIVDDVVCITFNSICTSTANKKAYTHTHASCYGYVRDFTVYIEILVFIHASSRSESVRETILLNVYSLLSIVDMAHPWRMKNTKHNIIMHACVFVCVFKSSKCSHYFMGRPQIRFYIQQFYVLFDFTTILPCANFACRTAHKVAVRPKAMKKRRETMFLRVRMRSVFDLDAHALFKNIRFGGVKLYHYSFYANDFQSFLSDAVTSLGCCWFMQSIWFIPMPAYDGFISFLAYLRQIPSVTKPIYTYQQC